MGKSNVDQAGEDEVLLMGGLIDLFHRRLTDNFVTVVLLFSYKSSDAGGGSTLKLHGVPCAAIARVTTYKERLYGGPDAEVTVDFSTWERYSPAERAALIDHELAHFLPVFVKKNGNLKTDRRGRPIIHMRPHDIDCGWFLEIAARHGIHSGEARQAREMAYHSKTLRKFFTLGSADRKQADDNGAYVEREFALVPSGEKQGGGEDGEDGEGEAAAALAGEGSVTAA